MDIRVMMKCGHAAQGQDLDGNPVCVICVDIKPGAQTVDDSPPDLTGRMARCSYDKPGVGGGGRYRKHADGDSLQNSSPTLAFFGYRPDQTYDEYYCGCWGWD